jgi:hypothetical protein
MQISKFQELIMNKASTSRVVRFVAGFGFAVCMVAVNATALGERPGPSVKPDHAAQVLRHSADVKARPQFLV